MWCVRVLPTGPYGLCRCTLAGDNTLNYRGRYRYIEDLLEIDRRRPATQPRIPEGVGVVRTPLIVGKWEAGLAAHPDREFSSYIIRGIRCGFRIGFEYRSGTGREVSKNMRSASEHPEPSNAYVGSELSAGRMIQVAADTPGLRVSRFGVIPKPHQSGKWRLITDLSSPKGGSVNDGVDPGLCSVSYASVDEAVLCIRRLGRGAKLAKFDIANAYRSVPVHPVDRLLLGMRWQGATLVDGALPFGLRSAPKLFTAVADAFLWMMGREGIVHAMHYLDDFLVAGAPDSMECRVAFEASLSLCDQLGFPVAPHKVEGPSSRLTFLGILIDTVADTLSLPPEKLARVKAAITEWRSKKFCRKRELLSLIGLLQHACRVVRAGRTFLRRMIDLASSVREPDHWVRLNISFRSDLRWWEIFLEEWNGVSLCGGVVPVSPKDTITSDASGRWGCGAFTERGEWFQYRWPAEWESVHITVKELLPIVVSVAVWGHSWRGCTIRCRCDNAAVVAIIRSGSSRDPTAMHLMRCLFFFTARYQIVLAPEHIPGKLNAAADSLSRDALPSFLQLMPKAKERPAPLPEELLEALVVRQPDWTSPTWRSVLQRTFKKA